MQLNFSCVLLILLTEVSFYAHGFAEDFNHREAKFVSNTASPVFLAAGVFLPLLEDGDRGSQNSIRTTDSVLTSGLMAEILKRTVREKRPNGDGHSSFPSGHATAAFSVAEMERDANPEEWPIWYGGATLIAASRVQLRRHYFHDVVAGGALGYGTSRLELSLDHGLLLFPLVDPIEHSAEVQLSMHF
jgi:membrane-associated phospholipid phosphatase